MTPSSLYDSEKFLFAAFDLGEEAKAFLNSNIGKYLAGVAKQEIEGCFDAFLNHPAEVEQLQKNAQRARDAMTWILEAINEGAASEFKLKELDAEEGN